jgi:3-(3-hydroxy-phenyl)propionate hydroxylase
MNKVQVIIVGAGPTGLMAANLLGQAGIDTLVIERRAGLSEEARAITIDDEGLRICQAVGLADALCKHALLNINAYYVSQQRLLVRVAPQHQPNGYPLISTFYQPDFEAILLKGIERFPSVRIHFGQTVETIEHYSDEVMLTVRMPDDTKYSLQCAYLLACDGGKSGLRQALGIALRPPRLRDLFYAPSIDPRVTTIPRGRPRSNGLERWLDTKKTLRQDSTTQRWLVIDYKDPSKQNEHIIFYCNPARPAVSVQGPDQRRRWEFMLKSGERDEDLLNEDTINSMIQQAEATLPQELQTAKSAVEPIQIERKIVYKFHATIASTFASGRVFLLGDAAHLMPPFGGQGMNSGLRDAHNLCWKLKLVIEGHASSRLLASYQQERYTHVARMITFSSLLGKLIMPTNPLLAWARDHIIRAACHIPFVQTQLSEMRVKPQSVVKPLSYSNFLVYTGEARTLREQRNLNDPHSGYRKHSGYCEAKGSKLIGRLLPQPYVTQGGTSLRLDEVFGTTFALLRLYEKPDTAFIGFDDRVWTEMKLRLICVLPQQAGQEQSKKLNAIEDGKHTNQEIIVDDDNVLKEFLQNRRDILLLIRPDHYIMTAFHVKQVKDVKRAAQKLMGVEEQSSQFNL